MVERVEARWEEPQDSGDGQAAPPLTKEQQDRKRFEEEVERDIKRGKEISAEIDNEVKASEDEEKKARLQAIAGEMVEIANSQRFEVLWGDKRYAFLPYEFKLIEGKDVNAFSLPGGIIYFYEGLIDFAESDDEIAAVVAHEISHASFRHMATMEREYNRIQIINIPILIAAALSRDSKAMGALMASELATRGLVSSWSVQAETSADYGAIQMMAKSRYQAVGMLTFMERLAFRDKLAPNLDWGIYRTHPPSQERANFIIRHLNEMKLPVRRSLVTTTFSSRSVPVAENHFELWFGNEKIHEFHGSEARARSARAAVNLNSFLDSVPQMFEVGSNGATVTGRNRELFKIEAVDLQGEGTPETAATQVVASMKRVVFDLSFRLWKTP